MKYNKINIKNSRGMVIYIVLIIAAFAFMMISNIMILNHGEINQLARTETSIRCEIATRSIFQKLSNELRIKSWDSRSFKTEPSVFNGTTGNGVSYTALLENSKQKKRQADLWITSQYGKVKRVVFYRINVEYSLFEKMNKLKTVFFSFFNPSLYGKKESFPSLQERVDSIIAERLSKERDKNRLVRKIQNKKSIGSIMAELGLPVVGTVANRQIPFTPSSTAGYSKSPMELLMGNVNDKNSITEGNIAVSRFSMVVNKKRTAISSKLMTKLRKKFGEKKAKVVAKSIGKISKNVPQTDILSGTSSNHNEIENEPDVGTSTTSENSDDDDNKTSNGKKDDLDSPPPPPDFDKLPVKEQMKKYADSSEDVKKYIDTYKGMEYEQVKKIATKLGVSLFFKQGFGKYSKEKFDKYVAAYTVWKSRRKEEQKKRSFFGRLGSNMMHSFFKPFETKIFSDGYKHFRETGEISPYTPKPTADLDGEISSTSGADVDNNGLPVDKISSTE